MFPDAVSASAALAHPPLQQPVICQQLPAISLLYLPWALASRLQEVGAEQLDSRCETSSTTENLIVLLDETTIHADVVYWFKGRGTQSHWQRVTVSCIVQPSRESDACMLQFNWPVNISYQLLIPTGRYSRTGQCRG